MATEATGSSPDNALIASDTYGEYDLSAFDASTEAGSYRVVLRKSGTVVQEFDYPAYKIWTLLAHWRDFDDVQPDMDAHP